MVFPFCSIELVQYKSHRRFGRDADIYRRHATPISPPSSARRGRRKGRCPRFDGAGYEILKLVT